MKAEVLKVNFKPRNPLDNMDAWVCKLCSGDTFRLSVDGTVYCASCRARVSTLKVVEK
jgi:uncharacterized Zn finger protein (UPF0148 family)